MCILVSNIKGDVMNEYKAIYKCRLCGKEFYGEAYKMNGSRYPTGSIYKQHKCDDGRYGIGDLLGTYEVKE